MRGLLLYLVDIITTERSIVGKLGRCSRCALAQYVQFAQRATRIRVSPDHLITVVAVWNRARRARTLARLAQVAYLLT
jgi:hypothetical protein